MNVNRDVADDFYRYKMPKLLAKVEGKGNGIKTVLVNVEEIAKALSRPPSYPTKFFGIELGAQIQCDRKNNKYIVNGEHTAEKLQETLHMFIKKYVLCESCDNPETVVKVKRDNVIMTCKACGHVTQAPIHRLNQYIQKNPPENDGAPADVKAKKRGKKGKKDDMPSPTRNGDENTDDVTPNGEGEAIVAGDDALVNSVPALKPDDEVDFGDLATKEAQEARMQELSKGAANLALSEEAERAFAMTDSERADAFYQYVRKLTPEQMLSELPDLVKKADDYQMREKAPVLLVELLIDAPAKLVPILVGHQPLWEKFLGTTRSQRYFLTGLEKLMMDIFPNELADKVPQVFQKVYMDGLVDEKAFRTWYAKKKSGDPIHTNAAPFMDWLEQASESEEDDEEEDVEIQFDRAAPASGIREVEGGGQNGGDHTATNGGETVRVDDEEINIDDI